MATYLVSIVSEQTIPNYLFIKEFYSQVDKFIFISTEKMEQQNKTNLLCEAAQIDKKQRIKTLIADDILFKNFEKLEKLNLQPNDTYLINLTGGTKMMAISVWQFFHKFQNTRFFYVPLGKNIYNVMFEDKPAQMFYFTQKITCEEYLKIYGIRIEKSENLFTEQQVLDIFNDVKEENYNLDKFPNNKLKKFSIEHLNKQIYTKWFEEYVYYLIKRELNLSDQQILTGIKLYEINEEKNNEFYHNDNEIDLFFIYNNNPFIIECKFIIGKEKINLQSIQNIVYKLAAVNKRFGISARATLFTLSDFSTLSENAEVNLKRRCKITNVHYPFFDRQKILTNFKSNLSKLVNN